LAGLSKMGETTTNADFWARTRNASKVMVLDLGFLGDTVHLFPALWMIRQAYLRAELHVIVAEHVTSLMECVPWVDCAWGYPRFPKHATLAQNIRTVCRLRKERFEVVINLNGSDRSSWLTWSSGAPERLGRLPQDGGPWLWRSMFTEVVEHPWFEEPAFLQKFHCLAKVGLPGLDAEFHTEISDRHLQASGVTAGDARTYFHISPFTTSDGKELSFEQTASLIDGLEEQFPAKRVVLSCAPSDRERSKMTALLGRLKRKPWRIYQGNLNLMELAALVKESALHLSGDTGPLHLALMANVPTVSWFRDSPGSKVWMPAGPRHRTILGSANDGQRLEGIAVADLLDAAKAVAG